MALLNAKTNNSYASMGELLGFLFKKICSITVVMINLQYLFKIAK